MQQATFLDEADIDFIILADRAEAVNGKLYLMGGAWNRLHVQDPGGASSISFAIGILIPRIVEERTYTVHTWVETLDGQTITTQMQAEFAVQNDPDAASTPVQRVTLAAASAGVRFPESGTYVLVARILDGRERRCPFNVVIATAPPSDGDEEDEE